MAVVVYNKLVRDKIPALMENEGKIVNSVILREDEYLKALDDKLMEEVKEYLESKEITEIADILEVLSAISAARGYHSEEVAAVREEKARARGKFDEKRFLCSAENGKI